MGYRVVQWATGGMGRAILRCMMDHPDLEVVGVYVYSSSKAGKDIGEIAARPLAGVQATNDVSEIVMLKPDVVVHAGLLGPYGSHDDEIVTLLEAGINVISINGYVDAGRVSDERADRLRAACKNGGSTLTGAGLNPGYIGEQIAVVASGVSSSLDHVEVIESTDASELRDPKYLFEALGFGADPASLDPNDPTWAPAAALNGMYSETVSTMAKHLGLRLERIETAHQVFSAASQLTLHAGIVPAGTVSHTLWRWNGIVDGRTMLTHTVHWYVESAHLDEPNPPLWRVRVTGHPGVDITVNLTKHPDDKTRMTAEQYAVGGEVVNTIPYVVAAEPGFMMRPYATPFRGDYANFRPHVRG